MKQIERMQIFFPDISAIISDITNEKKEILWLTYSNSVEDESVVLLWHSQDDASALHLCFCSENRL